MRSDKGITMMITIGEYDGFYSIYKKSRYIRLCLGWVAFSITFYKYEIGVSNLIHKLKQLNDGK